MRNKSYIYLIFLLLFFGADEATAQHDVSSEASEIKYGLQFRTGPTFRQYSNQVILSEYTGYNLGAETLSMRYELSFTAKLNAKWTLLTGGTYSNHVYFGTYYCHVCDLGIHPLGSERFEFKYLDLPLYARYRLVDRKIGWHVEFGTEFSIAINKITTRAESAFNLNNYSVNAFAGTGLDYNLNNRINLNATASYRRLIYSETAYKFNAFEVKAGLIYYFKSN